MNLAIALLSIVVLIVLHELGHFFAAKAVGMRVERFSLFFPPTIFKLRRGETEYAIGAIPAGGYVKITGMSPEEIGKLDPEVARRAYYNQAPWKRIVVILAGPVVNLAIAFVLFWAILASGNFNGDYTLRSLSDSVQTLVPTTTVAETTKGGSAYGTLKAGDEVVAVDGRRVNVNTVAAAIGAHSCAGVPISGCRASKPVRLSVIRAGHALSFSLYPHYNSTLKRMLVGVGFGAGAKHFGVFEAPVQALHEMGGMTAGLLSHLVDAFTSSKVRKQVHSIVGIAEIEQETVAAGPSYALAFVAFISLVLGIMNLLPFLPLDGGHIVWSLGEKLRGRRISLNSMYRYSSVGIVALLFLVINGFSNDIGSRLGG